MRRTLLTILFLCLPSILQAQDSLNISILATGFEPWEDYGAYAVRLNESHVCVRNGAGTIKIIQVPAPGRGVQIASIETHDWVNDLYVNDSLLYVINQSSEEDVFSLADPSSPVFLGTLSREFARMFFAFRDTLLYTSDRQPGTPSCFRVYQAVNPVQPVLLHQFEFVRYVDGYTLQQMFDIVIRDSTAFVVLSKGLLSLDISDPDTVIELDYFETTRHTHGLEVEGGRATLQSGDDSVILLDVSTPSAMEVQDVYYLADDRIRNMVRDGDRIHLTTDNGRYLQLGGVQEGRLSLLSEHLFPVGSDLLMQAGTLLSIGQWRNMQWWDVRGSENPCLLGTYGGLNRMDRAFVRDDMLVLSLGSDGLRFMDLSTPEQPVDLFFYTESPRQFTDVLYDPPFIFALNEGKGVFVFERTPDNAFLLRDTLAFQASNHELTSLARYQDHLYIADDRGGSDIGLHIVDITPEGRLFLASVAAVPAWNVDVFGDYLYVRDATPSLRIYSLANPYAPELLHDRTLISPIALSDHHGDQYYTLNRAGRIRQWDVGDPRNPRVVAELDIGNLDVNALHAVPAGVLIETESERINAWRAEGGRLVGAGYYEPGPRLRNIVSHAGYAYTCMSDVGLAVLDISRTGTWNNLTGEPASAHPENFTLETVRPNPFNGLTSVHFTLPRAGHVVLSVFDVLGREVAVVHDGVLPAGRHRLPFDAGRAGLHASGVYFLHAQTQGEASATKRLVLLQ
ncbi:T9SS type A sorting domain-containing protein [bacterium]|nr:T9SS type A sorting domain-containing protein [bacterium]